MVQSLCCCAQFKRFCLFCFRKSGFRTAILPCNPAAYSLRLMVAALTGFFRELLSSAAISGAVFLLFRLLLIVIARSSAGVVTLGLPVLFYLAKYPLGDIFYVVVNCSSI